VKFILPYLLTSQINFRIFVSLINQKIPTMKKANSIPCSDWHRNWAGILGRLSMDGELFTFKGHWQGRHGQKDRSYRIVFKVIDGSKIDIVERSVNSARLPDLRDVSEALRILNGGQYIELSY